MLLKISANKHLDDLTIGDLCQLRDEFNDFMEHVSRPIVNSRLDEDNKTLINKL